MASKNKKEVEKVTNYTQYLEMPLKLAGCWDWYPKPVRDYQFIINEVYVCFVLFTLTNICVTLLVNLYTEWADLLGGLEKVADGLPIISTIGIIAYMATYKRELYDLLDSMNSDFKFRSAKGLTNLTMWKSYNTAKNYAFYYTTCVLFSVLMYVVMPVIIHIIWTSTPLLQEWTYMDITQFQFYVIAFLRQALGQIFIGLGMGQFSVFFMVNSILLCGQFDLICCSLRNARYTALLKHGVEYSALVEAHGDIVNDEMHNYIYSTADLEESDYHYDEYDVQFTSKTAQFDIYSSEFDEGTVSALRDCARAFQIADNYKRKLERYVSPVLVLRVVQVTLFLCMLLYTATVKFNMITVEYLAAASLDIFLYCYFGNEIILQAERVSTAAYQCAWPMMGVRPRMMLLNVLLANRRPVVIRAGRFLPMDLRTFINIFKTSFSYYTLLVNVKEKR